MTLERACFGALLVLVGCLSSPGVAEVETWTDDEGNVHYGDQVPEEKRSESETVDVEGGNSVETVSPDMPERDWGNDEITHIPPDQRPSHTQESTHDSQDGEQMSCAEKKQAYRESKACFDSCARDLEQGGRNIAGCDCTPRTEPDC